jgi:hypothetical protein
MQMPGIPAHPQASAGSTLQRKPKPAPKREPAPTINPMLSTPAQTQTRGQVVPPPSPTPTAPVPPQDSGLYARNPAASGGWSRGDLSTTDPREVPAFLRRRDSGDGGYVR